MVAIPAAQNGRYLSKISQKFRASFDAGMMSGKAKSVLANK
jgi:hypothetical protein